MKTKVLANQNIYIVEKNQLARESMRLFLENVLKCTVVGEAESGKQCMHDKNVFKADVVLMDCEMPLNGAFVATKSLNYDRPSLKIIAMTMYAEKPYLKDLLFTGFCGCVFKQDIFETLGNTIEKVINGIFDFPECMIKQQVEN